MKHKQHTVSIDLVFTKRRDFLALKNAVSAALIKAKGSYAGYLPLRTLLDTIIKQAESQDWDKLWREYPHLEGRDHY